MALIQADAQNKVFRLVTVKGHEDDYRLDPNAAQTLEVDSSTNQALLNDVSLNMGAYTIVGGVLKKNGVDAQIEADTDQKAIEKLVRSLTEQEKAALRTGTKGFIQAMKNGQNPTQQQRDRALAWVVLKELIGD